MHDGRIRFNECGTRSFQTCNASEPLKVDNENEADTDSVAPKQARGQSRFHALIRHKNLAGPLALIDTGDHAH